MTFNLIMKRDDLISRDFPGDKRRKLALNLESPDNQWPGRADRG